MCNCFSPDISNCSQIFGFNLANSIYSTWEILSNSTLNVQEYTYFSRGNFFASTKKGIGNKITFIYYPVHQIIVFTRINVQIQPKWTVRGITYVCTERIFDSRLLMYNKIFLEKLWYKFLVHIFTLLLAPFTSNLVNYSRHSESLKYVWKSTICCLWRKMLSISDFFRMFRDSLWPE